MRTRPALVLLLVALLTPGCQRGCLADWLRGHGAAPATSVSPDQLLRGTDCPDGLARCLAGTVEASRVKRVPRPCPPTVKPEECSCPWEAVETCPLGCAAEGTEVVVERERAAARLCAPDPAHPVARLAAGVVAPPGVCEAVGYRCVASLVVACGEQDTGLTARVVAACVHGCFHDGEVLGEEETDPDAATRILCAR